MSATNSAAQQEKKLAAMRSPAPLSPWFYAPNIIGYCRFLTVVVAFLFCYETRPALFVFLYCFSFAFDFIDGVVARTFDQTSELGAALDVVVDNVSRQWLYCRACPQYAIIPIAIEWTTFSCTTSARATWKVSCFTEAPKLVKAVFKNNFRQPVGIWAIGALMFLPLWFYLQTTAAAPMLLAYPCLKPFASWPVGVIMVSGRLIDAVCEWHVISSYARTLVKEHVANLKNE